MIPGILSAIESVKVLNNLLKTAYDLKNYNEWVSAVTEVNARLLETQGAALSLSERISELEQQIMDLKNWEREAQRYQLAEIGSGVFAYRLKPGVQPPEPTHMLCANCYGQRKKSILQLYNQNELGEVYICHGCKSEISVYKNLGDLGGSSPGYDSLTYGR